MTSAPILAETPLMTVIAASVVRQGAGPWPRPVRVFLNGHHCHQYRMVEGFYECAHVHVRRIAPARRGIRIR